MHLKQLIWGAILLLAATTATAQSYTISGLVTDNSTGETMISATVYDMRSGKGALTNNYGRYSITLPRDTVVLRISYVGYFTHFDTFYLDQNRTLDIGMEPNKTLKTVKVTAEKVNSHRSSQMSAIEVPVEHIKAVPAIFGETDVLKALQLLPGVQSGSEGMSGMYVRGGGPDENLFLLNGVPVYNVNHLGGFFSAFNADAVKGITLYKGSFPAHFGGRLSSVVDITTNDGNDKKLHGGFSIGLISARLNLDGPIVNDKTTFSLSARRTYADLLILPAVRGIGVSMGSVLKAGYYFYDLNGKVTHKFSNRSRLTADFYMGDDVVYTRLRPIKLPLIDGGYSDSDLRVNLGYNWGNIVSSLRWNYELNPKLFMSISGAYTRYRNDVQVGIAESWKSGAEYEYDSVSMYYNSGIHDYCLRADFDYQPNPNHLIKFGGNIQHHIFHPDVRGMYNEESYQGSNVEDDTTSIYDTIIGESVVHANEINLYAEDDWSINETLKINAGIHASGFLVQGKPYFSVQPRLSGRLLLSDDLSVKGGYAMMTQYMHLLSNGSVNLPSDLWVPVTAHIAPMKSHQFAAGGCYTISGLFDVSVEGYYKWMHNLLEYREGATFMTNSAHWEDKVCMGDGWAYGVELLLQRTVGELTGWVGYTWSKTMRQFDRPGETLNHGDPFPAKYDRRHDISIMMSYKPNDRWDAGVTWVYSTGNVMSLAMQEYYDPEAGAIGYIESRNNFRLPAYHRMDIGVNFHKQLKHGYRTISISIYNLYNHKNPFFVYESNNYRYQYGNTRYGSALVQMSIFPFMPSFSYDYKF